MPTDALAVLDTIPREHIGAAIAYLAARQLQAPAADDWLTVKEAAALLHVSPRWVYDHEEQLDGRRIGKRRLRFRRAEVERALRRRR